MNQAVITGLELNGSSRMVLAVLDESRRLEDFQVFESEDLSLLNHIYVGRVDSIASNIQAAFVRFGPDHMGYLSLKEAENPFYTRKESGKPQLCAGDEILVQVVRDAIKTKLPVLSCKLEFFGTFCIVTAPGHERGVSRKISRTRADRMKELLRETRFSEENVSIVLRTNAENAPDERILRDVEDTIAVCRQCLEKGVHRSAGSLLCGNSESWLQQLRGVRLQELTSLTTDLPEIYQKIAKEFPDLVSAGILRQYQDPKFSLSAMYSLKGQSERLLSRVVWLDSGANIIIEQLETLTFIDVNTAKNQTREEGLILRVNEEAAREIARQLRLRNISGMILIDFVNMKTQEEQEKLIETVRTEIRRDHVPCSYVDMTGLGLMELTRKKVHKSLLENLAKITKNG